MRYLSIRSGGDGEAHMRAKQAISLLVFISSVCSLSRNSLSQPIRIEDVPSEMVGEFGECAAYCGIAKVCLDKSGVASDQVEPAINISMKTYFDAATALGMSASAIAAKYRLTFASEMKLISKSCANIAILIENYSERCIPLINKPSDRLGQLITGNNDWPSLPP
jgi:hypothetical protein